MDGTRGRAMIGEIHRLRDKPPGETEKITINVGFVDLGHIDLLVHEGFYSNRTDFIRTAIRNQLATHADAVKQLIVRHTLELGLRRYRRDDLEAVRDYTVYVPSHTDRRKRPLIIMLHGCTQNPDDFAVGTRRRDDDRFRRTAGRLCLRRTRPDRPRLRDDDP